MTPDPEPPVPSNRVYNLWCSDSLNNSHVVILYNGDSPETGTELVRAKISISDAVKVELTDGVSGDFKICAIVCAYSTAHPDISALYYEDEGDNATINNAATFNLGTYDSGTNFNLVYSGSSNFSLNLR